MGKGAGAMRPITPQQNTKMRMRMRLLAAVLAGIILKNLEAKRA